MDGLAKAVKLVGGVTQLARHVGVRQSAVSNWIARGRVPPERCKAIELATNGAVSAADLRPDLFVSLRSTKAA